MPSLSVITAHLDSTLRISELPDYSNAVNGLQLQNRSGQVTRIAAAVDATLPVVKKAVATRADLLIVHHGMFWSGLQPWTGGVFERMSLALENNLAIYSAHLPLDAHPTLGNNACIATAMGLTPVGGFLEYKGLPVGVMCEAELALDEVVARFTQALGGGRVHVCAGGPASPPEAVVPKSPPPPGRVWTPSSPARDLTGATRWRRSWASTFFTEATMPRRPSA